MALISVRTGAEILDQSAAVQTAVDLSLCRMAGLFRRGLGVRDMMCGD